MTEQLADEQLGRKGGAVHDDEGSIPAAALRLERARHELLPGPPLPEATSAASEGVLGSVIVISGGEAPGQDGRMVDDHWQLETAEGANAQWTPLPPPPLAVHGAQGAVVDGRFMIAGGAARPGQFSRFAWSGLLQTYTPGASD